MTLRKPYYFTIFFRLMIEINQILSQIKLQTKPNHMLLTWVTLRLNLPRNTKNKG